MSGQKRLLILGAGRGQVMLIKTAKRMGYQVIVATMSDNYPGVELADEVCYVDISNPQQVLEAAKSLNIAGVATSCNDIGLPALGYVCDQLHLKGVSTEAALRSGDKLKMKETFEKYNVSTARFRKVTSSETMLGAIEEIGMPVVVKAVDLQGSKGVYICRSMEEAKAACFSILAMTKKDYFLVEQFIDGYEFGAEAFVYNGEVVFVLPHGRNVYMAATAVPIGHYAPFEGNESIIKQTEEVCRLAIKAMGLDNCAVNFDLIIQNNRVYIIEMTGRVGANCLPELVSIYYGIDYYEMIVSAAMGEDPRVVFAGKNKVTKANASRMITLEKTGIVREIRNRNNMDDPNIFEITMFVHEGDEVRKFENSNDCVGQVVVIGDSYEECDTKIAQVLEKIEVVL